MRTASSVPMLWSASGTSSTSQPPSASSRAIAGTQSSSREAADEQLATGVGGDALGEHRVDQEGCQPDRVEPALGGVRRGAGAERLADDQHVVGILIGVRRLDVTAYPLLGVVVVGARGGVPPELVDGEAVLEQGPTGELEQGCGG